MKLTLFAAAAAFATVVIIIIMTLGCVEIGNVKIKVTKYAGDCMPPVLKAQCCRAFAQAGYGVFVDGKKYVTDNLAEIHLKLDKNQTHVLTYENCAGGNETLELNVSDREIYYEKTTVYNNAAYEKKGYYTTELVEINLPCCTA
jgi:ketopantoate reductase